MLRCHEGGPSPGGVMDWGVLPESRLLRLLLLLILVMAASVEGCRVDKCTREYERDVEEAGLSPPESSVAYCRVVEKYVQCLKETGRSCRGNLNYHSTLSLLSHVKSEYKCKQLLQQAHRNNATGMAEGFVPPPSSSAAPPYHPPPPPPSSPSPPSHPRQCSYHGRRQFRHCGLFGDPHLKTFNSEYQTCRIRGAWPLIDNPYLAVQVTNERVVEESPATATTKVTIVIRGRNTPCAPEKTYEASSEAALPATFIDGTQRSGPDDNVVLTVLEESRTVQIYVRYIETTLVVRQAGPYLAFAVGMPEELLEHPQETSSNLQLCTRGCPATERLDPRTATGHKLSREKALERCTRSMNGNLTDHYLDWCVFDVMTTGEDHAAYFTAAAHSAQADVLRLDPTAGNRTTRHYPVGSTGTCVSCNKLLPLTVILLLVLLRLCV